MIGVVTSADRGWYSILLDSDVTIKRRSSAMTEVPSDSNVTEEEADEVENSQMSGTLKKYREVYEPSISAGGRKSLNNGDKLARFLSGMSAVTVMTLADIALDLGEGFCEAKYAGLNEGSKRMNSGNRLRAAVRKFAKSDGNDGISVDGIKAAWATITSDAIAAA